jgi:ribosomal small subunit protein bTHX
MHREFVIIASQKRINRMGKGDKKSKKGKIWRDSYGNSRRKRVLKAKLKRNASKKAIPAAAEESAAKPKRTTAPKKKGE